MIERKAEKEIFDWMDSSKEALLVDGARQVGKTFLIRACLEKSKSDFLEVNLIEHPEMIPILDQCTSVKDLVINLSAVFDYHFEKGKTILFFDEIQECTDIVTKIKFWVDEGSFRYILSGSLLGVELKSLRSAPVGYLREIHMFPLDFEEFIRASGVLEETIEYLKECFFEKKEVSAPVHEKLMKHFKRYLVVGGMPAAVREYVDTGDISRVTAIQKNIIELYKLDFTKYEARDKKLMLISIYELLPSELLKQNRRFNYNDLKKGLRFKQAENSFLWLSAAGVALPVYNTTEPSVSLKQNVKSSLVKLYLSDVGLLTSQYGNTIRMKILSEDDKINLGGIYENAVCQEFYAHGMEPFFYNNHKIGELDFVIEKDASVIPVEIKSGKDYYVHSAISKVSANAEYEVENAYIFANCNVSCEGKIVYYPVYMCGFVNEETELPVLEAIEV